VRVRLCRNIASSVFSTSSEVGSGKASRHPSTASSSTVLYLQLHSSSAFDNPQVSSSSPAGHSNVPRSTTVGYMRQQHSYNVPSSSTVGTAMYPVPLWCDIPSNSIFLECQVPLQGGTPTSAVPLQYCTCSNNNLHQCAPLW
jgi:hypothetical protein